MMLSVSTNPLSLSWRTYPTVLMEYPSCAGSTSVQPCVVCESSHSTSATLRVFANRSLLITYPILHSLRSRLIPVRYVFRPVVREIPPTMTTPRGPHLGVTLTTTLEAGVLQRIRQRERRHITLTAHQDSAPCTPSAAQRSSRTPSAPRTYTSDNDQPFRTLQCNYPVTV